MLISVIIPTFNSQHTIERSIISVLSQTYKCGYEIIIVDDASTDDTVRIVSNLKFPEINLIVQKQNSGAGAARNRGLAFATGDYIAFLDSDDIWLSNKIELQMKIFKYNSNVSLVSSGVVYFDIDQDKNNRKKKVSVRAFSGMLTKKNINLHYFKNRLSTSAVIVKKDAIGSLKFPSMRRRQDWVFWCFLLEKNCNIYLDPEILVAYDTGIRGLSNNFILSRVSDFVAIKNMLGNRVFLSACFFLVMLLDKLASGILIKRRVTLGEIDLG